MILLLGIIIVARPMFYVHGDAFCNVLFYIGMDVPGMSFLLDFIL